MILHIIFPRTLKETTTISNKITDIFAELCH